MAGRKALPTAVLQQTGNHCKRPLNGDEPTPEASELIPPPLVADDPIAAAEYIRIGMELRRFGVMSVLDEGPLVGFALASAQYQKAIKAIREEGEVFMTARGFPMPTPWLAIARDAKKEMDNFYANFGMTPSARSKITRAADTGKIGKGAAEAMIPNLSDAEIAREAKAWEPPK